jgi:hypothetical protein
MIYMPKKKLCDRSSSNDANGLHVNIRSTVTALSFEVIRDKYDIIRVITDENYAHK